jgi:O-acetyl-ADP-ribose deacetylase (regulator of RNase III)
MKLIIVTKNTVFIDRCKEYFSSNPNVTIYNGLIQDIKREGAAFVSPANSLGFMDGGIDEALSRHMFPGCEKEVKRKIAELAVQEPQANIISPASQGNQGEFGHKTLLGRPYLRVGSAQWIYVNEGKSVLISAPTMFLPHPIKGTQNVYWAMQASLLAMKKVTKESKGCIDTMVITSMGCGVGCMDAEEAALQVLAAWKEYETGTFPEEVEDKGIHYVLLQSHDEAQPSNYDNREIGVPWPMWSERGNLKKAEAGEVKKIQIQTTYVTPRGSDVCYDA